MAAEKSGWRPLTRSGPPDREGLDQPGSNVRRGRTLDLQAIIESTATPAYAVDSQVKIVAWNAGAEHLLGSKPGQVIGRACHEVVCGVDLFGNRFCGNTCPVRQMARRREPVRSFEIFLKNSGSPSLRVRMHILVTPGPSDSDVALIHLLEPVRPIRPASDARAPGPSPPVPVQEGPHRLRLTAREVEVLRLLETGKTTHEIADRLFISAKTVQNHVYNTLRKLGAHSRLEAVSLAREHALI